MVEVDEKRLLYLLTHTRVRIHVCVCGCVSTCVCTYFPPVDPSYPETFYVSLRMVTLMNLRRNHPSGSPHLIVFLET